MATPPLLAVSPDWARPYLKRPVPTGPYIAKSDRWVAVYTEISVGIAPSGGLSRTYRQVLAPTGDKARRLTLSLEYDEVTQALVEPKVWVRGGAGYRELNLKKAGRDAPELDTEMITSGRFLFISTQAIEPDEKAIVSWQVQDKETFPGEYILLPFGPYPSAEFTLRRDMPPGSQAVALVFLEPQALGAPKMRDGELSLREVPALRRIYDPGDPWLASITRVLPFAIARAESGEAPNWTEMARKVTALFQKSLESDTERAWKSSAVEITAGVATPAEKVPRLAAFVQSLAYRNIAWGKGAYLPQSPSESLRSRSADCKGKAVLLQALLSEVGIRSVPVLCHIGGDYFDSPPVPTIHAFDHVVVAIRLPDGPSLPASLTEDPGRGWVLFDPTDPLSVLGEPPPMLEGTAALWLDLETPGLFTVHTSQPGARTAVSHLSLHLEGSDEAYFDLTLEGHARLLAELADAGTFRQDPEKFRTRCQEHFQPVAPGIKLSDAHFYPVDHLTRKRARLELKGRIPAPLQAVGGGLFTLASPMLLTGLALDVPRYGYQRSEKEEANRVVVPPSWSPEPCCQAYTRQMRGEITLTLPAGWSLRAHPELPTMDTAWSKVRLEGASTWAVGVDLPRGIFPVASQAQRLKDLNSIASLFRQPFLVKVEKKKP